MISEKHREDFTELIEACDEDQCALLECTDKKTGNKVYVVCAVYKQPDGTIFVKPIAKMFDGEPTDELMPPGNEHVTTRGGVPVC